MWRSEQKPTAQHTSQSRAEDPAADDLADLVLEVFHPADFVLHPDDAVNDVAQIDRDSQGLEDARERSRGFDGPTKQREEAVDEELGGAGVDLHLDHGEVVYPVAGDYQEPAQQQNPKGSGDPNEKVNAGGAAEGHRKLFEEGHTTQRRKPCGNNG